MGSFIAAGPARTLDDPVGLSEALPLAPRHPDAVSGCGDVNSLRLAPFFGSRFQESRGIG